jgi:hypothetical protein
VAHRAWPFGVGMNFLGFQVRLEPEPSSGVCFVDFLRLGIKRGVLNEKRGAEKEAQRTQRSRTVQITSCL